MATNSDMALVLDVFTTLDFLTHLHLERTCGLTNLKLTHQIDQYSKQISRGIDKHNKNNNFQ